VGGAPRAGETRRPDYSGGPHPARRPSPPARFEDLYKRVRRAVAPRPERHRPSTRAAGFWFHRPRQDALSATATATAVFYGACGRLAHPARVLFPARCAERHRPLARTGAGSNVAETWTGARLVLGAGRAGRGRSPAPAFGPAGGTLLAGLPGLPALRLARRRRRRQRPAFATPRDRRHHGDLSPGRGEVIEQVPTGDPAHPPISASGGRREPPDHIQVYGSPPPRYFTALRHRAAARHRMATGRASASRTNDAARGRPPLASPSRPVLRGRPGLALGEVHGRRRRVRTARGSSPRPRRCGSRPARRPSRASGPDDIRLAATLTKPGRALPPAGASTRRRAGSFAAPLGITKKAKGIAITRRWPASSNKPRDPPTADDRAAWTPPSACFRPRGSSWRERTLGPDSLEVRLEPRQPGAPLSHGRGPLPGRRAAPPPARRSPIPRERAASGRANPGVHP